MAEEPSRYRALMEAEIGGPSAQAPGFLTYAWRDITGRRFSLDVTVPATARFDESPCLPRVEKWR